MQKAVQLYTKAGVLTGLLIVGSANAQTGGASDYTSAATGALSGLGDIFKTVFTYTIPFMGLTVLGMVAWKYAKKLGNKV